MEVFFYLLAGNTFYYAGMFQCAAVAGDTVDGGITVINGN